MELVGGICYQRFGSVGEGRATQGILKGRSERRGAKARAVGKSLGYWAGGEGGVGFGRRGWGRGYQVAERFANAGLGEAWTRPAYL